MLSSNSYARILRGVFLVVVMVCPPVSATTHDPLTADISSLIASRKGLHSAVQYLEEQAALFNTNKQAMPGEAERAALRSAWQVFLDHILALDAIGERNNRLYHEGDAAEKERSFQLAFAAFLAEYRYALAFLALSERSTQMHTILNEPVPELGLPADSYAQVKFRFLNILRASEFSWLTIKYKTMKLDTPLSPLIDEDIRYITRVTEHGGPSLTAKNAGRIVTDTMFTAWFPVQKGVSEWMGDTKVLRHGKDLITEAQLQELLPKLQPGDLLLVRREWYLSNVGLPGYWPHAALYIGTADERRAYFSDDNLHEWVVAQGEPSGDFERLLSSRSSAHYQLSTQTREGELPRVIEAISEGVSFTGLKHAAGGDSLVVLRPRLEKMIKARAILRAFQLAGRPYDFDFNFLTDASLVCTELVYKAYEGEGGLTLPLETVMGRPVLPANRIARLFDEEYAKPSRQFDFVAFYDGDERAQRARHSDEQSFRASAQRPKWHIFLPSTKTKWVSVD